MLEIPSTVEELYKAAKEISDKAPGQFWFWF